MEKPENKPVATLPIIKALTAVPGLNQLTQTEALACENGFAELAMPFDPTYTQHHGFLHGGLIAYLADTSIAWSAASLVGDVLTSEFRVHFLAPGKGQRFIARGNVIKASRRQVVAKSDVFAVNDGVEKLIATATGTCLVA
ncbi:PaaI family thioesterase [Planktotalea sp.]|uniref:PaaI family thioesterase n=1 Tax=Planktotalea sp. TaxID=2029877 RepID=UPI003299AD60